MTREIKFRAWNLDEGYMLDPESLASASIRFLEKREAYSNDLKTYKYEIMQFTGFKDKNGKEVFEFDHLNDNYEVRWSNGKYVLHGITTRDIMNCDESTTKDKIITGNRFIQEDPQGGAD